MALFSECMPWCARKVLDTADIVRDAIFQQLCPLALTARRGEPGERRQRPATRIKRKASACKMTQPYPSFSDFQLPLMQGG